MAQKNNKTSSSAWREYLAQGGSFFMSPESRRWMRNIAIALIFIVFVWLTYTRVYGPLKEDVPLPVSVDQENPTLDLRVLQSINTQRSERIKRDKPDYFIYSRVFIVPKADE
jgi:hypothetical protein